MATLSEQLVNAMANYISGCYEIPIEKSCDFSSSSMDTIKSEIADNRELAKVLVWNKNLEIVEVLSLSNNLESQELSKFNMREYVDQGLEGIPEPCEIWQVSH